MFWHAEERWKTVDTDAGGSFTRKIRERAARSQERHWDTVRLGRVLSNASYNLTFVCVCVCFFFTWTGSSIACMHEVSRLTWWCKIMIRFVFSFFAKYLFIFSSCFERMHFHVHKNFSVFLEYKRWAIVTKLLRKSYNNIHVLSILPRCVIQIFKVIIINNIVWLLYIVNHFW